MGIRWFWIRIGLGHRKVLGAGARWVDARGEAVVVMQ